MLTAVNSRRLALRCRWGLFHHLLVSIGSSQCQKINFCKWNWPGKVCKWICHDLKIGTLKLFLEENIVVQSIWSRQSLITINNIPNRGTDQFALLDTIKKLEIAFGIAFENWSNGFMISSNLKHNMFLTSKMQCKRNFNILVN